MRSCRKAIA